MIGRVAAQIDLEEHLAGARDEVAGRKWMASLNSYGGLSVVRLDAPNERGSMQCRHTRWRSRGYSR